MLTQTRVAWKPTREQVEISPRRGTEMEKKFSFDRQDTFLASSNSRADE